MTTKIIKNALISTGIDNDTQAVHICIENELISDIIPANSAIPKCDDIIDATDLIAIPAGIDPHVHFDTPGYTFREDFMHGTAAAASGGITCIIDMPDTSIPSITDCNSLANKQQLIQKMAIIDYALWGGISGNVFRTNNWKQNIHALHSSGAVGFKCYLLSGMDTFTDITPNELKQIFEFVQHTPMIIAVHAEDKLSILNREADHKYANHNSAMDYYSARQDPGESEGIYQVLHALTHTSAHAHIVHVGSAAGVAAIWQAKVHGLNISAETCPHFLEFNYQDFNQFQSLLKTAPVVKTHSDNQQLWSMLAKNRIDFIASDHAPCPPKEKITGSIWSDYGGIAGCELLLPYLFSAGYKRGRISFAQFIELTSTNTAKRFGLYPNKGSLNRGTHADITLIHPDESWQVDHRHLHSLNPLTPFELYQFTGKIKHTLCRGHSVYTDTHDILVSPGFGKWQRPQL